MAPCTRLLLAVWPVLDSANAALLRAAPKVLDSGAAVANTTIVASGKEVAHLLDTHSYVGASTQARRNSATSLMVRGVPDWVTPMTQCVAAVNRTLTTLTEAYTAVQVDTVLLQSCGSFEVRRDVGGSEDACKKLMKELAGEFKAGRNYDTWCRSLMASHDYFGSEECPCIGFDGVDGDTLVTIGGQEVKFPADLGGSCQAWDSGIHPQCASEKAPSWCASAWCYVDPRHCHIPVLPKTAPPETSYQPTATYQNLPLYFSYSTCEAKDTWSKALSDVGKSGCRCIGFDGSEGTNIAQIGKEKVEFPAEIGGECKAWDDDVHPDCKGKDAPAWCGRKWCFVDPCSCDVEVPPKTSGEAGYFPTGKFQGKALFYSYSTCSEKDAYSSEEQVKKSQKKIEQICNNMGWPEEYGTEKCPCVGIDDIEGETMVSIGKKELVFPADLGGSCQAWDSGRHPECKADGEAPSWCDQKWCYVDAKHCDIAVTPKSAPPETSYQPKAKYQGAPLYYSYSACGSKDFWADAQPDAGTYGCRCVGFDNSLGTNVALIGGKSLEFPAEIGGECKAWDDGVHPACKGKKPKPWCAQKWCFVDPCSCDLKVPPKTSGTSGYFPHATFQGRPLFYSYKSCGGEDSYTSTAQMDASNEKINQLCHAK